MHTRKQLVCRVSCYLHPAACPSVQIQVDCPEAAMLVLDSPWIYKVASGTETSTSTHHSNMNTMAMAMAMAMVMAMEMAIRCGAIRCEVMRCLQCDTI
jgi:hypothetical protein